jgi:hypothetical protein
LFPNQRRNEAFVLRLVDDPIRWAGVFVGLKLVTFGGTLCWIALQALQSDTSLVYELEMPEPEVAELKTRFVEWLAFHFGGPAGKQLSLTIRRIGAAVTRWLVSQGGRNRAEHRAGNRGL